jgi:ABC-type transporter Mla subunit MlaD
LKDFGVTGVVNNIYLYVYVYTRTTSKKEQKQMRLLAQALLAVQIALAVALPVLSDSRDALRQRLDSLEVETQVRKRSGKPIDALEAASAQLRDSIVGMRSALPPEAVPVPAGGDGAFFERTVSAFASFLDSAFSFKPAGLFDWIIVSTGVVAVLSGLL